MEQQEKKSTLTLPKQNTNQVRKGYTIEDLSDEQLDIRIAENEREYVKLMGERKKRELIKGIIRSI